MTWTTFNCRRAKGDVTLKIGRGGRKGLCLLIWLDQSVLPKIGAKNGDHFAVQYGSAPPDEGWMRLVVDKAGFKMSIQDKGKRPRLIMQVQPPLADKVCAGVAALDVRYEPGTITFRAPPGILARPAMAPSPLAQAAAQTVRIGGASLMSGKPPAHRKNGAETVYAGPVGRTAS